MMPRKSIFGENAKLVTFRLYSWETQMVKDFINAERQKRKAKIKGERKNDTKKRS